MLNTYDFLKLFHGDNKSVIKVHKYIKDINNYSMVKIDTTQIEEENKNGCVYFIPNIGGDKDEQIHTYTSIFVDLDCGKDEKEIYTKATFTNSGKKKFSYFPLDVVIKYKQEELYKINSFPLKPTFIIETRNGFHVHFLLIKSPTRDQWKECIEKLIIKFDSDKKVKNDARLMRIPFTNWMKDKNNPYMINLTQFYDVKYDIETILKELKDIILTNKIKIETGKRGFSGTYIEEENTYCPRKTPEDTNINLIKHNKIEELQKILKIKEVVLNNQQEFYDYITKEIHLSDFLGVSHRNFNCIFHNDETPSAGIFVSKLDQYMYKCHSESCGFIGNIIRCVERIKECNRLQAINFIKEVYNLNIIETDWQKEQKAILEENKRMIRSGELEEFYPEVYKLIKKYLNLIYLLHDKAIDCVRDEDHTDDKNNVTFFASLSSLQNELKYASHSKIPNKIGLFAFLCLIKKLNINEIPKDDLSKSLEYADRQRDIIYERIKDKTKKKKEDIFVPLINYFSIPSYCDNSLKKSLERAFDYNNNNITMTGWSREILLRTFGEEIANEVYPQFKHIKNSKKSNIRTSDIHKIANELVGLKGYVVEKEIVEILKGRYGKNKTEVQIKKSLQEMLDSYDWKRVRLNKMHKEALKIDPITVPGYPYIIIKNFSSLSDIGGD